MNEDGMTADDEPKKISIDGIVPEQHTLYGLNILLFNLFKKWQHPVEVLLVRMI